MSLYYSHYSLVERYVSTLINEDYYYYYHDCRSKIFGINMCCSELPVSDESSAETACNLAVDILVSTSCQGASTVPNTSLVRVICTAILIAVVTRDVHEAFQAETEARPRR